MTKTYDGNDQTTYTLNSGRVIVLTDNEFDEIFVGSEKRMELHEKIIELECEVASKNKEISKNNDYEEKMDKYLDYTTNGAMSKSVATPLIAMKQEHDSNIERLMDENKSCEWEIIDDEMDEDSYESLNVWFSDCKAQLRIPADETLKNNQINYCPKCGGKIKLKEEK